MKSLFLHDPNDLTSSIQGGVQICSEEFLEVLHAASKGRVKMLPVHVTRNFIWRLRRRLGLGSYLLYNPEEVREALSQAVHDFQPTHVFLNRCELLRLAPLVRKIIPTAKIVMMSHGNQSGDDLYEVSGVGGRRSRGVSKILATWQLGLDLVTESCLRHSCLDGVCVMSSEESVLERWLGSTAIVILPRIIRPRPLNWNPTPGRVGFVGTLSHTPNRIALERLCDELRARSPSNFELRLVGGPENIGEALAAKYSFINYVGRLDEAALECEVVSWSLFLNPIFWLSRGASMKLGQSLSWAIPSLTTRAGMRGYQLAPGQAFLVDDSAEAFAVCLLKLSHDKDSLVGLREELLNSVGKWPDAENVAANLRSVLA